MVRDEAQARIALSQSPRAAHTAALDGFLSGLAQSDPGRAMAELDAVTAADALAIAAELENTRSSVLRALAMRDPHAALALVAELDPKDASAVLRSALPAIVDLGTGVMTAAISALPTSELRDEAVAAALSRLAVRDVQAAAALIDLIAAPGARMSAHHNLARAWASRDPDSAYTWASSLPADERSAVQEQVVARWAWSDLDGALSAFAELSAGHRAAPLLSITSQMARTDPSAALQWLEGFDTEQGYHRAYQEALRRLLAVDPATGARMLAAQDSPRYDDTDVQMILRGQDADAAIAWVQSIQNAGLRATAANQLAMQLAARDFDLAEAWVIRSAMDVSHKDAMLVSIILAAPDDGTVERVLAAIRCEETRAQALATLVQYRRDPDGKFLQRLPASARQKVLEDLID